MPTLVPGSGVATGARDPMARRFALILHRLEAEAKRSGLMPVDEGIHELRRIIKRLRALLQLAPVGRDAGWRLSWDSALRALAHRMAPSRDRCVRQELLGRLVHAEEAPHQWLDRIPSSCGTLRSATRIRDQAARQLSGWISRIASIRPVPLDERVLRRALRRSWNRMDKARRTARRSSSISDLHRWRRRQKRWEIQCRFVGCPPHWRRSSVARSLHRLQEEIGLLHDVDGLLEWLRQRTRSDRARQAPPKALLRRVKEWRRQLRGKVLRQSHGGLTRRLRKLQKRCLKGRGLSQESGEEPA